MNLVPNIMAKTAAFTASAGSTIVVQVLNPDGSVAETISEDTVPAGQQFTGSANYWGVLKDPASQG